MPPPVPGDEERVHLESLLDSLREAGPPPRLRGTHLTAQELPPDLVDGFTLLEEIGQGGQGVVFRAQQHATGREVALKILREGPLADVRSRHRFARETEIVASLEHPGIVTLYGAGRTADGHGWVAMEIVDGKNLRDHLHGANLATRLELLEQVCEALAEAHRHGVIHLDLKPANVLVKESGQVRVVDFGLARSILQDAASLSVDALGGTPGFMAPEQVRGGITACDTRTDIHALGALLFFLLTGRAPYEDQGSVFSTLEAVASGKLCSLEQAISESSCAPSSARARLDFIAVCHKALALEPSIRYRSVSDFQADLQALRSGGIVEARQGERRYRWTVAFRRLQPVLLILVVAAGITWVAVEVALRERALADLAQTNLEQAQTNFEQAQEIAEAFLLEIDPLLANLPGSGPARERIIQRGTDYLNQLLETAPDDAQLRLKAARGFHAIALVQADIYTMSSGRLEEAFSTLQQLHSALPTAEQRMELSASEGEFAFVLEVQAHMLAVRVARDLGQDQRYRDELQSGLALFENGCPFETIDAQRAHSAVLEEWSRYLLASGDVDGGRDYLRQSRQILEGMVDRFQQNVAAVESLQRDLAVLIFHEATLAEISGDLKTAEQLLLEFHTDATDRMTSVGGMVAKRDASTAKERLSAIAATREDFATAIEWIAGARSLRMEVLKEQAEHPSAWADQISMTNRMGELHLAAGQLEQAGTWFDNFVAEAADFEAKFPDFPRASRMLGVAYYKRYELAQARSQPAEALAALNSSLEVFYRMQAAATLAEGDGAIPAALEEEKRALEQQLEDS